MDALGMTSRWIAAARERESRRPDRLFDDPLAGLLAGDEGRATMASIEAASGVADNPYLTIRTRFLDDFLVEAMRDDLRQIVILAAGMDARAFRLAWPPGTVVFEVERGEVLDHKRAVLAEAQVPPPRARRVEIRADLRGDYRASLRSAGYSESQPTAFLLEGLLPYLLDETTALSILSGVAAIAAPDSRLALDMIGQSFLHSPFMKRHLDHLRALGVPWQFGDDDPEGLLSRAGFTEVAVRQPGEVGHGRWPHPTVPRSVPGIPRAYLVVARRRAR
jgi:methyltransferase (TIGR00027 family)